MQRFNPAIRWWSIINPRLIAHFSESVDIYEDRIVFSKGVFNKSQIVIPASKITNYSINQSLFERMFGVSDFVFETAGSTGPELILKSYPNHLKDALAHINTN